MTEVDEDVLRDCYRLATAIAESLADYQHAVVLKARFRMAITGVRTARVTADLESPAAEMRSLLKELLDDERPKEPLVENIPIV